MRQRVSRHSYLISTVSTAFRSGSKLTWREGGEIRRPLAALNLGVDGQGDDPLADVSPKAAASTPTPKNSTP